MDTTTKRYLVGAGLVVGLFTALALIMPRFM